MGRRNSLIPILRNALHEIAERDGHVTMEGLVSHVKRDVDSYGQLLSALDPKVALDRMTNSAAEAVLRDWPAYETADGYVHVDPNVEHPAAILDRIVALRERQLGELTAATQEWKNRAALQRVRELQEAQEPEVVLEPALEPVEVE